MHIPRTVSLLSILCLVFASTQGLDVAQRPDESGVSKHQSILEDDPRHGREHGHGLGHEDENEQKQNKLQLSAVLNEVDAPYNAIVQCWELASSFVPYPTTGRASSLGDTSNATYVVLPPRGGEGWHRPPGPMYFILLSGLAHVKTHRPTSSTPTSQSPPRQQTNRDDDDDDDHKEPTESLYIVSGVNPLIIAVDTDTRSPGHLTFYPSEVETVALQVPFKDGKIPEHHVLYDGPCRR